MLINLLRELVRRWSPADMSDEGATAVEYALLVGLIAVIIISSVTLLGGNINDLFADLASKLSGDAPVT